MTNILTLPKEKSAHFRDKSQVSGSVLRKKHRKFMAKEDARRRVALIDSIKLTQNLLREAHHNFRESTDPDLVEAYIYEINALQSRHNYLSKQLR